MGGDALIRGDKPRLPGEGGSAFSKRECGYPITDKAYHHRTSPLFDGGGI